MGAFFIFLHAEGWRWGSALPWSSPLFHTATTVTFAAIVVAQIATAFVCRSERMSVFRLGWRSNPLLLWGIAIEAILLLLFVYTPPAHLFLGTGPLPFWVWPLLIAGACGLLLTEEFRKFIVNRQTKECVT